MKETKGKVRKLKVEFDCPSCGREAVQTLADSVSAGTSVSDRATTYTIISCPICGETVVVFLAEE